MAQWLTDNIGNICICILLVAVVVLIIRGIVRDKRQGKSSCGCNCGHCAMAGTCHYKAVNKKNGPVLQEAVKEHKK